ncbi:PEP motif putative anchor-like protein [Paraglaciecola sp. T6c]|uniref:SGNH/GDSL hydrolase family protein n=1 Tax=Pseudoalteromonas atlantica (strain T6c / ATCC BAA-1087) TaxID=3042615 RepID=UPI00005C680B|nr:SGNH/GDSL hydrolase family protein [Paraglaciecola sp. T6c]ABG41942.1 PEP motif putative anchor-like protein [Paraglaciecola sp. T6c]
MNNLTLPLSSGLNYLLKKTRRTLCVSGASLLMFVSSTASATPISDMYVFGDSLSDTGALKTLLPAACPTAPYFDCRFSNGPVWVEHLASDLGVSASTAYTGGTNWAIGGQRTDNLFADPNFGGQLFNYLGSAGGMADADALYVIWAGGNDFLQNDPVGTYTPGDAAQNIVDSVTTLAMAGAMNFLVPNLPIAAPWAFEFNAALANGLDGISGGLNITQLDVFSTFLDISMNPSDYDLTNVSAPCVDSANMTVCTNPDEYLLWDQVHPTAVGHQLIASAALAALAVPEPALLALFGFGMLALVRTRRKVFP